MSDLYVVHFAFNDEAATARFEFAGNAIEFAKHLEPRCENVRVLDEFASTEEGEYVTVYPEEVGDGE